MRLTSILSAILSLAVFLLVAGCSSHNSPRIEDQPLAVPIVDPLGYNGYLRGHICRPVGVEKPQLVVINHGSTADEAVRAATAPTIPILTTASAIRTSS